MKKNLFFALLSLLLVLTACNDVNPDGQALQDFSFVATADNSIVSEDDTRTSLTSDYKIKWATTDAIDIFNSTGTRYTFSDVSVSSDGLTATFKGSMSLTGDTHTALYPSQSDARISSGAVTATLPSTQTAVAGSFASGANLAIAQSADQTLQFKNVGAILSVKVLNNNIASATLSAKGRSGASLAGKASIAWNGGNPVATIVSGESSVTLTGGLANGSKYYFVVYPGTYDDLQIVFTDRSGRTATYSSPRTLTVARNQNVNLMEVTIPDSKWVSYTSEWVLVNDASSLKAGDILAIACKSEGVVAGTLSSNSLTKKTASFSADGQKITSFPDGGIQFTLSGSAGAWKFSDESNHMLGAPKVKSLSWDSGTMTWKISFSGDNLVMESTTSDNGRILYNQYASIFRNYKNPDFNSYAVNVQLYRYGTGGTPAVSSVTTNPTPEAIGFTSASLSATFTCAIGVPSSAGFQYGTTNPPTSTKAAVTPTSKRGTFTVGLTGLAEDTKYYYRAYVVENGVTIYGDVESFTTDKSGGAVAGRADYNWPELPAQTDLDKNGIDDNNSDYYYSHTFRADASNIRNFSCCYSKSKIHPVWVAAPMHKSYKGSSGRNDSYKADPNIRCTQAGSWNGYTRGHMLGSSDRTISKETNRQVFYYSNIGAQLSSGFNTGGGAWNNLEALVDDLWFTTTDTLYQVIGCIFDTFTDKYGNTVSPRTSDGSKIPTAYYKVMLRSKTGNTGKPVSQLSRSELMCVGFVLAHKGNQSHQPQVNDMYTVQEVEQMTGLTFFVNVPNAPKDTFTSSDWL